MALETISRFDLMALFDISYMTARRMATILVEVYELHEESLGKQRIPTSHLELHKKITNEEIIQRLKEVYQLDTYKRNMQNCNKCISREKPCAEHKTAFWLMTAEEKESITFNWESRKLILG